jgi:hypothetical protein
MLDSADSLAYPDTIPARLAKSAASKAEKLPLFIDLKRGKSGHNQIVGHCVVIPR